MSSYRSYTTWNKNTPSSNYGGTTKTESTLSKYESPLTRSTSKENKDESDKSTKTTPGGYRSGAYSALNQRDRSVGRDTSTSKYSGALSKEKEPEKASTTIRDKYTGTGTYPGRRDSITSRTYPKPAEKKEAPPVSFRGLSRPTTTTGSRSRDPSPAEREKTDNYRLYSRPYTRSTSREPEPLKYGKIEPKEDIATIAQRYGTTITKKEPKDETPKYGGRSSITKEETTRYGGRTSLSRQESREDVTPRYGGRTSTSKDDTKYSGRTSLSRQESREDVTPKYGGRTSLSRQESKEDVTSKYGGRTAITRQESKEDITPKYGRLSRLDSKEEPKYRSSSLSKPELTSTINKYGSRNNSKEDLSLTAPKSYINSRFLPKNTIEKSFTYSKPVNRSLNAMEERRKRDNIILTQVLNRQKHTTPAIILGKDKTPSPMTSPVPKVEPKVEEVVEMETVSVVTRGTSPAPSSQSAYHRQRRTDLAKDVEKDITRPKKRPEMVDKEIQSDRMDDTARYSRFSSSSTMSATMSASSTPWSSYLDLKFNSPRSTNYNTSSSRYSSGSRPSKESSPVSRTDDKISDIRPDSDISRCDSTGADLSLENSLSKSSLIEQIQSLEKSLSRNSNLDDVQKSSSKKSLDGDKSEISVSEKSPQKSLSKKSERSEKSPSTSIEKSSSIEKSPTTSLETTSSKKDKNVESLEKSLSKMSLSNGLQKSSSKKSVGSDKGSSESLSSSSKSSKTKSTTKSDKSKDLTKKSSSAPSLNESKSTTSLSTTPLSDSKSKSPPKTKSTDNSKKLPPLPKGESPVKSSNSCHSITTPNKDFRKSVLNMGDKSKKSPKRSNSVSSDSEQTSMSEANDTSTKLSTSQSLPKIKISTSGSKLPQKVSKDSERSRRSKTRSPSVCSESSDSSSSDEEPQKTNSKKKLQILSGGSSRTSMISADELSYDKSVEKSLSQDKSLDKSLDKSSPKPPPSPRAQGPKTEAEAKSFLMRALAPVTNFFKPKQDSGDKLNLDSSSENLSDNSKKSRSEKEERKKMLLKRIESGERAWWMEENGEVPEGVQKFQITFSPDGDVETGKKLYKIIKQESGEAPWWLTENGEIPEGVEKFNGTSPKRKNKKASQDVRFSDSSKSEKSDKKSEFSQPYRIRHIDSGERAWWMDSNENIPEADKEQHKKEKIAMFNKLMHQKSGEKAWWLMSNPNIPDGVQKLETSSDSDSDSDKNEPLGDRASPEGLETPQIESGRLSPYDNVPVKEKPKRPTHIPLFISRHTNIDDLLGGSNQLLSPLMDRIMTYQNEPCEEVDPGQVRIHDSTAQRGVIQPNRIEGIPASGKLDDAALQLYKDGDYSSYLDLEASISEQQEEFEGFETNKKNSIVLRTQLSVRVHTIIEKLLNSEGRELRRALFSLKQIFQEDKDLVHEFVQNDGLACLIKVGSEADQNYQNYILRALGQVMLYVDGMNGVMEHNQTVQWLYTLIASKFRLVVKTALKLLLVFVEYTDSNCMLLIKAVNAIDGSQGLLSWSNIMRLLKDFNSADTELLIYAMTLVNKCLNGIPDQDTYYDQTDALEEQGIEGIIQRYMSKQGTDLDLLQQFQIYEAVLQHEDGEDKGTPLRHLDESIRKTLRNRKSMTDSAERRRSRRHSTGTTPGNVTNNKAKFYSLQSTVDDEDESSSSQSSGHNDHNLNGSYKENHKVNDAGVTPALRRRRERAERQRSFIREQQESAAILRATLDNKTEEENGNYTNMQKINGNLQLNRNSSRKDLTPLLNAVNKLESTEEGILKKPWVLSMMYGKPVEGTEEIIDENADNTNEDDRNVLNLIKRENTVKDLTQKLANQNILHSPSEENKVNRIGDMSGLISKAKEGLAKSKSKADVLKSPTSENVPKIEVKKSENELRWEELVQCMSRPLNLCDMDFTDLHSEDEVDILAPAATSNGIPPPPPPLCKDMAPPPPPIGMNGGGRNPPPFPTAPMFPSNFKPKIPEPPKTNTIKKNKKTVKLFWKEVRDDPVAITKLQKIGGMIWDELQAVTIDTQKLEHLFESRAKDLISKKQQEMNKNKEIIVLDHKRSNAINIGMTKLPPPRSIKTAILKMDATIMNREGIEKLLTMLPTEEERTKIQDAQTANPDLPLGSAEQFLITLASISELPARLKLWAFKLDFENSEREIAEPLMDLKQGIEVLRCNTTFRGILSTLLSIGIFLNGNEVKGFQIEYLAKVPEVKDTVHKHSLLHHLCHIVMEKFPEATDLYSEIGAITRASKIDFDELSLNIQRLESDCKSSWDHLKLIAKHDGSTMMKVKMSDFLADCAERIILLGIVHRRVMNRYHKFLLWLGIPLHRVADSKPNEFCRVVSEFSLEYRTTRERVLQQLEKKANHRERNKTRGKMITEVGKFRTKEDRADAELRQLLGSDISDVESMQGTLPWRRTRKDINHSLLGVPNGNITDDGDDEILESLVKTATKAPSARTTPRERKRTRHADRKSLRRTLKNGLSEEEKKHIAAYIKGY